MKRRLTLLLNLLGLWAFGLITGANASDLLAGEPTLHPWVMLAIGVIGSFIMYSGLQKELR